MRRAVFRADASATIGGGHIHRCLHLAEALAERGWDCAFASVTGSAATVPALASSGFAVRELPAPDGLPEMQAEWPSCDLLIVDHYGLDATFEVRCRGWAKAILVIDDLANRAHDCDVLLDQTAGRSAQDYAALVPGNCRLLAGASYAILGRAFRDRRRDALQRRDKPDVKSVLVSFGSVDMHDLSSRAIQALNEIEAPLSVDVVLGATSPNLSVVREKTAAGRHPVRVHVDTSEMADLIGRADIGMGAAGTSVYERCCLGLPSIAVVVAGNQKGNLAALRAMDAAICIDTPQDATAEKLREAAATLIDDNRRRAEISRAASQVCDGWGAARVAVAVTADERAKDGHRVWLRPVTRLDSELLYAWQSSPGIRRHSRNPAIPARSGHETWFARKLADSGCLFNIIMHDERPAGMLRFDACPPGNDRYEISILVAPDRQNLGIGLCALRLGRMLLPDATILAEVLPGNDASRQMFRRAGYREAGGNTLVSAPAALTSIQ
jgi:UDP-2,4-diacetamido-2,4,6-trideoxy-beta-L-altropyranose hydrolase